LILVCQFSIGQSFEGEPQATITAQAGQIIANSDTSSPLIYGDFGTGEVTINGDLTVTGTVTSESSTPGGTNEHQHDEIATNYGLIGVNTTNITAHQAALGYTRRRLPAMRRTLRPTRRATLGQRRQVAELEVPYVARPGGWFNGDGG